jgi:hypothetical protein
MKQILLAIVLALISLKSFTQSIENAWITDKNGMYFKTSKKAGNIGIGIKPSPTYPLMVYQRNTGIGHASAIFVSDDTWQSAIAIKNNVQDFQYVFQVGGPLNTIINPSSFAIVSTNFKTGENKIGLTIEGTTGHIGIGHTTLKNFGAKSTLHLFSGDINIEQIGSGIILKSQNGTCWRVTIDDEGNLIRTKIICL